MSTSGACVSTCTQVHEYYSCGTRPKRAPSRQTGPTAVSAPALRICHQRERARRAQPALLAFTQVSLGPYTAGTVVGLLPFSAVYCYAGAAGAEVAADAASGAAGAHEEGPVPRWLILGAGVIATLLATWKVGRVAGAALDAATEEREGEGDQVELR